MCWGSVGISFGGITRDETRHDRPSQPRCNEGPSHATASSTNGRSLLNASSPRRRIGTSVVAGGQALRARRLPLRRVVGASRAPRRGRRGCPSSPPAERPAGRPRSPARPGTSGCRDSRTTAGQVTAQVGEHRGRPGAIGSRPRVFIGLQERLVDKLSECRIEQVARERRLPRTRREHRHQGAQHRRAKIERRLLPGGISIGGPLDRPPMPGSRPGTGRPRLPGPRPAAHRAWLHRGSGSSPGAYPAAPPSRSRCRTRPWGRVRRWRARSRPACRSAMAAAMFV